MPEHIENQEFFDETTTPKRTTCRTCRTTIAPGLLACPGCQTLVHADRLSQIATEAQKLVQTGNVIEALKQWRNAIEYLPPESQQYQIILGKIDELSQKVDKNQLAEASQEKKGIPKSLMALGAFGLMIWKFKFIFALLLTKGKLLLMGLTKAQTFFSMFLAFSVYWTVWGWKFALGLVLSIYVHEMGHVFALRKFGIPASVPTFIPGVGALVRLKQAPANPMEDARVGLAGPLWGLFAALVCYGVFLSTGSGGWGAIAKVGAWINLFNLLPIMPLDGGRGFRALSSNQKWITTALIGLMWYMTAEGLLLLLLVMAVVNALGRVPHDQSDHRAFWEYGLLVVILSIMTTIEVPV